MAGQAPTVRGAWMHARRAQHLNSCASLGGRGCKRASRSECARVFLHLPAGSRVIGVPGPYPTRGHATLARAGGAARASAARSPLSRGLSGSMPCCAPPAHHKLSFWDSCVALAVGLLPPAAPHVHWITYLCDRNQSCVFRAFRFVPCRSLIVRRGVLMCMLCTWVPPSACE